MKSPIMTKDQKALIALCKSMTPEERLTAYFKHSRLVYGFYQEGLKIRRKAKSIKAFRT